MSKKVMWSEMVAKIESELCERGPVVIDERKMQFLTVAYLRDIRDALVQQQGPGAVMPAVRSAWDVPEEPERDTDGDTRPFAFIEELRADEPASKRGVPRPSTDEDGKKK